MFDVGVPELILVLVVALVVFGPGKLPEIGASIGKALRDFRGATQAITDEVNSVKKEVDSVKDQVSAVQNFDLLAEDEATTRRILAEQEAARQAASGAPAGSVAAASLAAAETPVVAVESNAPVMMPAPEEPVTPAVPAAPLPPRMVEINAQIAELEDSIYRHERNRLLMGDASTDGIIATIRARIELLEREGATVMAEAASAEASAAPAAPEPAVA